MTTEHSASRRANELQKCILEDIQAANIDYRKGK